MLVIWNIGHWNDNGDIESTKKIIEATVNENKEAWGLTNDPNEYIHVFVSEDEILNDIDINEIDFDSDTGGKEITEKIDGKISNAYLAQLTYLYNVTWKNKGMSTHSQYATGEFVNYENEEDIYNLQELAYVILDENEDGDKNKAIQEATTILQKDVAKVTEWYFNEYYTEKSYNVIHNNTLYGEGGRIARAWDYFQKIDSLKFAFMYRDTDTNERIVAPEAETLLSTTLGYVQRNWFNDFKYSNKDFNSNAQYWSGDFVKQMLAECKNENARNAANNIDVWNVINNSTNSNYPGKWYSSSELYSAWIRNQKNGVTEEEFYKEYFKPGYIIAYTDEAVTNINDSKRYYGIILQGPAECDFDSAGTNFYKKQIFSYVTTSDGSFTTASNPFYYKGKWAAAVNDVNRPKDNADLVIRIKSCSDEINISQEAKYWTKENGNYEFRIYAWYNVPDSILKKPDITNPNEPEDINDNPHINIPEKHPLNEDIVNILNDENKNRIQTESDLSSIKNYIENATEDNKKEVEQWYNRSASYCEEYLCCGFEDEYGNNLYEFLQAILYS